ncbi:hypothetical protein E2C01_019375 [Portunus trituberculatus]|uniref:Uncharacterized protein n=1 Tax=Portunus trituberculatus TaxID=210409 RepID=A0A5B7DXF0_PORTR|nr:hypothetical protein [Portunus trituberculatus]
MRRILHTGADKALVRSELAVGVYPLLRCDPCTASSVSRICTPASHHHTAPPLYDELREQQKTFRGS